jgi:hypothetical protein
MFTSISWEIFLTTVVVLLASYYLITALVFYRKEIVARITSRSQPGISAIADSSGKSNSTKNVMGQVNKESESSHRFSIISADELSMEENSDEPDTITAYHVTDPLISSMYDLLAEARALIQVIVEQKSSADECEELFRSLMLRYPQLKQTDHRDGVAVYIAKASEKQLPYALSVEQVVQWWNEK